MLESVEAHMREQMQDLLVEKEKALTEVEVLEHALESAEIREAEFVSAKKHAEADIAELRERLADVMVQKEHAQAELDGLKPTLQSAEHRAEETAHELAGLRKQSEAQISELRQCLADAKLEKEHKVTELTAELADAESELQRECEQHAAEVAANRAERDSLRSDVGTHRDRIEKLLCEAVKAECTIDDLEANLKSARQAHDEVEDCRCGAHGTAGVGAARGTGKGTGMEAKLESSEAEAARLPVQVADAQATLQSRLGEAGRLERRLESELHAAQEEVKMLRDSPPNGREQQAMGVNEAGEGRTSALHLELGSSKAETARLWSELEEAREAVLVMGGEAQGSTNRIARLESDLSAQQRQLEVSEAEAVRLQGEVEEARATVQERDRQRIADAEHMARLESELRGAQAKAQGWEAKLESREAEAAQSIKHTTAKFDDVQRTHEDALQQSRQKCAALEIQARSLEQELEVKNHNELLTCMDVRRLGCEADELRAQLAAAQSDLAQAECMFADAERKADDAECKADELRGLLAAARSETDQAARKVADAECKASASEQLRSEAAKQLEDGQHEAEKKLKAAWQFSELLAEECEALREELRRLREDEAKLAAVCAEYKLELARTEERHSAQMHRQYIEMVA